MNVLSLFSGIGAFEKAMTNLNIPYNLVNYCEIDKYASKSYAAIHGVSEDLNLIDVTTMEYPSVCGDIDLITYAFPCQDFSVGGFKKGFVDNEGNITRSGLFFDALRIIDGYKPKFAIAENVKALTGKKFEREFDTVLTSLKQSGYNNYWQVLNAKDYDVPQNRERVFVVSIRKDIDKGFEFPQPIPLNSKFKDYLDENVDERFYLNTENYSGFVFNNNKEKTKACPINIGFLVGKKGRNKKHQSNTVYSIDGLCPTCCARDYKDPIRIAEAGEC